MNECEITLQINEDERLENTRNSLVLNGHIIKHDGNNIPIITDKLGELWYHAQSVCKHLCGFKNTKDILSKYVNESYVKLLEDIDCDVDNYNMDSLVVNDEFITEAGVYLVLLKSSNDTASSFRNFVASQILPQINKTGNFVSNDDLDIESIKYRNQLLSLEKKKHDIRWQENELKLMQFRKDKMAYATALVEEKDPSAIKSIMSFLEK